MKWQICFDISGLQISILSLENRVQILEQNGGSGDNGTISDLEIRVSDLETDVAVHGQNISDLDISITDLETDVSEQREDISGLEIRVGDLETEIADQADDINTNTQNIEGTCGFSSSIVLYFWLCP